MNRKYLLLIFLTIILLPGCMPKGDPKEAIDAYNQYVMNGDFANAYDLLSGEDQKEVTKEEYIQLQHLNNEISKCISLEAKKVKEYSNQFGYRMVTEYEVTEKWYSYSEEKEYTSVYPRYVVNDGGEWKVYNEGNYKKSLAMAYIELGWMYLEGKGKPKNLQEAKKNLEQGLGINPLNGYGHYLMGKLYNLAKEYDLAIFHAQKALEFASEDDVKDKSYYELGIAYQGKGNPEKAKEYFQKAAPLF